MPDTANNDAAVITARFVRAHSAMTSVIRAMSNGGLPLPDTSLVTRTHDHARVRFFYPAGDVDGVTRAAAALFAKAPEFTATDVRVSGVWGITEVLITADAPPSPWNRWPVEVLEAHGVTL